MDAKYLAEIKARRERAKRDEFPEYIYGSAACHLVETDIPALLADSAAKDQQIATLKKALEIASSEVNKAFETLESHHVITMTQKASGIQENVDTWVHRAQEQEVGG